MSLCLSATTAELRASFFFLETREQVASLLDVKYNHLVWIVYRVPEVLQYAHFSIPKKSGGTRTIMAPISTLKIIQRKLSQVLNAVYKPKPSAHGFVEGRSIVTNAKLHARNRYVLNLDLKEFFPSINFGRVRGMLMGLPYKRNAKVATLLAAICCAENQLPQGAPTSPVVSNMICARMDSQLQRLAEDHRCYYSRYADDITFSTNRKRFPQDLALVLDEDSVGHAEIGPKLSAVIKDNGFAVNPDKFRLQARCTRQEVTGLTTNMLPNVRRRFAQQIRAMIHAWKKYGLDAAEREFFSKYDPRHRLEEKDRPKFKNVLLGKLSFLAMVKGKQDPVYRKLLTQYCEVDPDFVLPPTPLEATVSSLLVLETPSESKQGTAFNLLGVGFVTCAHATGKDTYALVPSTPRKHYKVKVVAKEEACDLALISVAGLDPVRTFALPAAKGKQPGRMDALTVVGFPNYHEGDKGVIHTGHVTGSRTVSTIERLLIDAPIIAGASGGPVLNDSLEVIGIAATGADTMRQARETEFHSVIPIEALRHVGVKLF